MEGNLGLIGKVLFFFFCFVCFFLIQIVCLTQCPLNFSVKAIKYYTILQTNCDFKMSLPPYLVASCEKVF